MDWIFFFNFGLSVIDWAKMCHLTVTVLNRLFTLSYYNIPVYFCVFSLLIKKYNTKCKDILSTVNNCYFHFLPIFLNNTSMTSIAFKITLVFNI